MLRLQRHDALLDPNRLLQSTQLSPTPLLSAQRLDTGVQLMTAPTRVGADKHIWDMAAVPDGSVWHASGSGVGLRVYDPVRHSLLSETGSFIGI